jgi:uncharacterized protein YbaA (DUF1428 family)
MTYIDAFVLPVPRKNIKAYISMSKTMSKIMLSHGALEFRECSSDDIKPKFGGPGFAQIANAKKSDVIIFAWIAYKSKAHRKIVTAKTLKDPRFAKMPQVMPFDMKKHTTGGFNVVVDAIRGR